MTWLARRGVEFAAGLMADAKASLSNRTVAKNGYGSLPESDPPDSEISHRNPPGFLPLSLPSTVYWRPSVALVSARPVELGLGLNARPVSFHRSASP